MSDNDIMQYVVKPTNIGQLFTIGGYPLGTVMTESIQPRVEARLDQLIAKLDDGIEIYASSPSEQSEMKTVARELLAAIDWQTNRLAASIDEVGALLGDKLEDIEDQLIALHEVQEEVLEVLKEVERVLKDIAYTLQESQANTARQLLQQGLGWFYEGELELAQTQLQKALEHDSSCHLAYYHLGHIHYYRKEYEQAARYFELAAKSVKDPLQRARRFALAARCMSRTEKNPERALQLIARARAEIPTHRVITVLPDLDPLLEEMILAAEPEAGRELKLINKETLHSLQSKLRGTEHSHAFNALWELIRNVQTVRGIYAWAYEYCVYGCEGLVAYLDRYRPQIQEWDSLHQQALQAFDTKVKELTAQKTEVVPESLPYWYLELQLQAKLGWNLEQMQQSAEQLIHEAPSYATLIAANDSLAEEIRAIAYKCLSEQAATFRSRPRKQEEEISQNPATLGELFTKWFPPEKE